MPFIRPLTYAFQIDYRGAALTRLLICFCIVWSVYDISKNANFLLSDNMGVFSRQTSLLSAPELGGLFGGLYFMCASVTQIYVMLGLHALVAVLVGIGYKTSLLTPALWLLHSSHFQRTVHLTFGGDMIFAYILFWNMFIDWGNSFSVDSWLKKANVKDDNKPKKKTELSVATVAYTTAFFCMYFLCGVLKRGPTWRIDYHAVENTLMNDFYAGGAIARFIATNFPQVCRFLTASTIYLELGGPLLMMCPILFDYLRGFALAGFLGLQLGFVFTITLAWFPFTSIASQLCLTPSFYFDALDGLFATKDRKSSKVFYDPSSYRARLIAAFCQTFLLLPCTEVQPSADHFSNSVDKWGVVDGDKQLVTGKDAVHRVFALTPPYLSGIARILSLVIVPASSLVLPAYDSEENQQEYTTPPPPPRWTKPYKVIKNVILAYLLVAFCVYQYSTSIDPQYSGIPGDFMKHSNKKAGASGIEGLPEPIFKIFKTSLTQFGLMADWNLFAPDQSENELLVKVVGTLHDGTEVDLLQALSNLDFNTVRVYNPENKLSGCAWDYMPNMRTHCLIKRFGTPSNKWMVCHFSDAMCKAWNSYSKVKNLSLKRVEVMAQAEVNEYDPVRETLNATFPVWQHRCTDVFEGQPDYSDAFPTSCTMIHPGLIAGGEGGGEGPPAGAGQNAPAAGNGNAPGKGPGRQSAPGQDKGGMGRPTAEFALSLVQELDEKEAQKFFRQIRESQKEVV